MPSSRRGVLIVISGPAGSGKTTLCDRLLAEFPAVRRVITTTTRVPREGEVNGVDYHFCSVAEFEAKIAAGDFYEHAHVHGRYYGSERQAVLEPLRAGRDLLLNIDVQGAASYREAARKDDFLRPRLRSVFIQLPDLETLRTRLRGRGTDEETEIDRRIASAAEEMPQAALFDDVILSASKEADYAAFRALYLQHRDGPAA